MKIMFHVTSPSSVDAILSCGLVPCIGRLSQMMSEPDRAVFLSVDSDALESAWLNWTGGARQGDPVLALLLVDADGLDFVSVDPVLKTEASSVHIIEPSRISVLSVNLDDLDDFSALAEQFLMQHADGVIDADACAFRP